MTHKSSSHSIAVSSGAANATATDNMVVTENRAEPRGNLQRSTSRHGQFSEPPFCKRGIPWKCQNCSVLRNRFQNDFILLIFLASNNTDLPISNLEPSLFKTAVPNMSKF